MTEHSSLSTDSSADAKLKYAGLLCETARQARLAGQHEAALVYALQGLGYIGTEDPAAWYLKAEIATSGWHSTDPTLRERGAQYCEELALSREFPAAARDVAWRNLFWYTKHLEDLAPSLRQWKTHFDAPEGFYPMNLSIVNGPDGILMNVRCVNYRLDRYRPAQIITRNYLCAVDSGLDHVVLGEIEMPADFPVVDDRILGLEDLRLWYMGDRLWGSATCRQHTETGFCQIVLISIDDKGKVDGYLVLDPGQRPYRHEKNWMPVADGLGWFIYSCDPTIVCQTAILYQMDTPPIVARDWRGSSQAIPFDNGFLAIVHEATKDVDPAVQKPQIRQRFVLFSRSFQIRAFSWGWDLGHEGVAGEYVCGMCEHPDGERLVISYGVLDREAWLATVLKSEVRAMLRSVEPKIGQ